MFQKLQNQHLSGMLFHVFCINYVEIVINTEDSLGDIYRFIDEYVLEERCSYVGASVLLL